MMEAQNQIQLTFEEYLQLEQDTQQKYEYYGGYVYTMTGVSYAHNTISGSIFSEINQRLKSKDY